MDSSRSSHIYLTHTHTRTHTPHTQKFLQKLQQLPSYYLHIYTFAVLNLFALIYFNLLYPTFYFAIHKCCFAVPPLHTQCSTTCGPGYETRSISCNLVYDGGRHQRLPNTRCRSQVRPRERRPCNLRKCPLNVQWFISAWSEVCNMFSFYFHFAVIINFILK